MKFPASLFKLPREDRSYRTDYYEMCSGVYKDELFEERLLHFRTSVDCDFVYNTMYKLCSETPLDDVYKRFYIEIVTIRYATIISRIDFDDCYNELERRLWRL